MPEVTVAAGKICAPDVKLVANEVTTITFADNIEAVDIMSDGAATIYYTVDGSTPTIGGQHCYPIPAGVMSVDPRNTINTPTTLDKVKLISAGTPTVYVVRA